MEIVLIDGELSLPLVGVYLDTIAKAIDNGSVTTLRVGIDSEGLKFKVGNGIWSPGIGAKE